MIRAIDCWHAKTTVFNNSNDWNGFIGSSGCVRIYSEAVSRNNRIDPAGHRRNVGECEKVVL